MQQFFFRRRKIKKQWNNNDSCPHYRRELLQLITNTVGLQSAQVKKVVKVSLF